jgi:hypothetical protein
LAEPRRDLGRIEIEEHFEVDWRQVVLFDHVGDFLPLLDGDLPGLRVLQTVHEVCLLFLLGGMVGIERAELRLGLKRIDDVVGRRLWAEAGAVMAAALMIKVAARRVI